MGSSRVYLSLLFEKYNRMNLGKMQYLTCIASEGICNWYLR